MQLNAPNGNKNIFAFHIFGLNVYVHPWIHSAGEILACILSGGTIYLWSQPATAKKKRPFFTPALANTQLVINRIYEFECPKQQDIADVRAAQYCVVFVDFCVFSKLFITCSLSAEREQVTIFLKFHF